MSAKNRERRANKADPAQTPAPPGPRVPRWAMFALLIAAAFGVAYAATLYVNRPPPPPAGMVWIPPGEFVMGTAGATSHKNEQPAHKVKFAGFWIDETEVTNAQFREFVAATGYVTTAEKPIDWDELKKQFPDGTPRPPDDKLVPGALVFTPPPGPVPTDKAEVWWKWTVGANWQHPEGPASTLDGRDDHPVVQVSWDDATAYAAWAEKRLPTEAEWEYAARGGLPGKRYPWGDEPATEAGPHRANIWHGTFPHLSSTADGFDRTAPVKSFAPNGYGLYDTAGNVWEWCDDWYRADAYVGRSGATVDPKSPSKSWDPSDPLSPKRVTRGGSFLCHVSYCESYRTAARRGTTADTGMSHIGFRCVRDAQPR